MIMPMELIDYAEQQGLANYQWQQRVNETTRQEANITLGFLLAGGGASIAWSVADLAGTHPSPALASGVLSMALWLFLLAAIVQFRCLGFVPSMPPANQPLNVYLPKFNTESIRVIHLDYLESSILFAISKGQFRAKSLYRIRLLTCLSPVVFLAAWRLSLLWLRYFVLQRSNLALNLGP